MQLGFTVSGDINFRYRDSRKSLSIRMLDRSISQYRGIALSQYRRYYRRIFVSVISRAFLSKLKYSILNFILRCRSTNPFFFSHAFFTYLSRSCHIFSIYLVRVFSLIFFFWDIRRFGWTSLLFLALNDFFPLFRSDKRVGHGSPISLSPKVRRKLKFFI